MQISPSLQSSPSTNPSILPHNKSIITTCSKQVVFHASIFAHIALTELHTMSQPQQPEDPDVVGTINDPCRGLAVAAQRYEEMLESTLRLLQSDLRSVEEDLTLYGRVQDMGRSMRLFAALDNMERGLGLLERNLGPAGGGPDQYNNVATRNKWTRGSGRRARGARAPCHTLYFQACE